MYYINKFTGAKKTEKEYNEMMDRDFEEFWNDLDGEDQAEYIESRGSFEEVKKRWIDDNPDTDWESNEVARIEEEYKEEEQREQEELYCKANDLISLSKYAEMHGKSLNTVRQKVLNGSLKAEKIGRNWVINKDTPYVDNRFKTTARTAKVHTVYIAHCRAKDSSDFAIVFDQACVNYELKLMKEIKKNRMLDEDITLDNAILRVVRRKTMSTDKILNWEKGQRYCCAIRDPYDASTKINMIQEWGGRDGRSLFTRKNLACYGYLFSFCNKSKIVEAVNERKLVAVDGLGVITKEDLDKIEELQ